MGLIMRETRWLKRAMVSLLSMRIIKVLLLLPFLNLIIKAIRPTISLSVPLLIRTHFTPNEAEEMQISEAEVVVISSSSLAVLIIVIIVIQILVRDLLLRTFTSLQLQKLVGKEKEASNKYSWPHTKWC